VQQAPRSGAAGQVARRLVIVVLALVGVACKPPDHVSIPRPTPAEPVRYAITPGDELDIRFYRTPELNVSVPVRGDGRIQLDLVGEIEVGGHSPEQVARELEARYGRELEAPRVAVLVKKFGAQVYVGGEVKDPSRVEVGPGITALQAINAAGGFVDRSMISWVILIRRTPTAFEGTRLALNEAVSGEDPSKDIELQPGDIIDVPKKPVVHLNIFVEQYIQKNLPIQFALPVF
jgi:polysaccharide biosynthesis/export protein